MFKLPSRLLPIGLAVSSFNGYFTVSCDEGRNKDKISWNYNYDGMEDNHGKGTRTFVMIRHGQYVQGEHDKDRILTELGRKQALATGKRLNTLLSKKYLPPLEKIYHSSMVRAAETNELILSQLDSVDKNTKAGITESCDLIREGKISINCRF